ncbi:MAG: nickel/cobalt transporter [Psychromonas sp.]
MKNTHFYQFIILLFIGTITILAYQLYIAWPSLLLKSIRWQGEINNQLSDLLYLAKENIAQAAFALSSLSFTYGVLHSLGPGHGKVIVTTYLATHPSKVKMSLLLTVLASLMQALVAIVIVSLLVFVFNFSMREVNAKVEVLISFSFICLMLLGSYIIYRALVQIISQIKQNKTASASTVSFTAFKPTTSKPSSLIKQGTAEHLHSADCGCGHQHVVDPNTLNNASSVNQYIAVIFSIGIRPCTGAIMVLLFANMLEMYWLGVVSALLMAVGTACTISTIALLTVAGKKIIYRYLTTKTAKQKLNFSSLLLQSVGGALLLITGLLMFSGQSVSMSPIL